MTNRPPNDERERTRQSAEAEARFVARAALGSPAEGLRLLDKLDRLG